LEHAQGVHLGVGGAALEAAGAGPSCSSHVGPPKGEYMTILGSTIRGEVQATPNHPAQAGGKAIGAVAANFASLQVPADASVDQPDAGNAKGPIALGVPGPKQVVTVRHL